MPDERFQRGSSHAFKAAVALQFAYYNSAVFISSLRITPAMEGATDLI